jgi:hypothetical protein
MVHPTRQSSNKVLNILLNWVVIFSINKQSKCRVLNFLILMLQAYLFFY